MVWASVSSNPIRRSYITIPYIAMQPPHSYLWPVLLTNCPTCLSLHKLCKGNSWTNPPISQILHLTRTSTGHSFSYKFNPVLIMTALKENLGKSLIKGPCALQRLSQQLFKKNGCGNRCPHISCCSLDLVRHNFSSQNNHTHTHTNTLQCYK